MYIYGALKLNHFNGLTFMTYSDFIKYNSYRIMTERGGHYTQ